MINVLHLGLSYKCNMNCNHCYVIRKEDRLQENDYYSIIDTLYENGLFFLYYTFGEPLCSPLFNTISSYAKKKGIVQVLMTNGSLIAFDTINMLRDNSITKVCISIDHIDSNKHDNNRKYKGSFNKAIESLRMLVANNIKSEISMTVNDTNAMCLYEVYNLAQSLSVNFISFLRQRNSGCIEWMKNEELYLSFFEDIILKKQNDVNVLFHDPSLLSLLNKMKNSKKIDKSTYERYREMNRCHYNRTISIEPNGDVKRCNLRNIVIGNTLHTSLSQIVEKEINKNDDIIHCSSISK
ncbi:MAG: radical SAM protein [Leptospirales bacterium]|nr:radical SAM protein [Leptospirales bacterium]MCL2155515.1 radical SAM protein [Leptospirales bacterium]